MSTKVRVLRHAGLGRPAGHAGTPLDDQQAMLGLYAVLCYCSTRLSARPTRSVIKKYALADSLQRMSQGVNV